MLGKTTKRKKIKFKSFWIDNKVVTTIEKKKQGGGWSRVHSSTEIMLENFCFMVMRSSGDAKSWSPYFSAISKL